MKIGERVRGREVLYFIFCYITTIHCIQFNLTAASQSSKGDEILSSCSVEQTGQWVNMTGQELSILEEIPEEILKKIVIPVVPDEKGMVGHNRESWVHASFQRGAMMYLILAAIQGDTGRVEDAWRAIDAAFERQNEAGNFETGVYGGKKPTRNDDLSGTSFWMAQLCHALLILQLSELSDNFSARVEQILPRIRKTVQWLYNNAEELYEYDANAPNRLFFDAMAFGFAGILLEDEKYMDMGRWFAEAGIELMQENGSFLEKGGHDSGYQAVALLRLQQYLIYFPDEEFSDATKHAASWEISRVKESGEVDVTGNTRTGLGQEQFMGRIKDVNYGEVVLALLYYGIQRDNEEAIDAALRAYQFASGNR
jgi:hypothetical protein